MTVMPHGDSPHGKPSPSRGFSAQIARLKGLRQRCGIAAVTLRHRWCGIIYPSYGGGSVTALPHSAGVRAWVRDVGECSPSEGQPRDGDAAGPSGDVSSRGRGAPTFAPVRGILK